MRTAFPLRQKHLLPAALLVLVLFLLGLALGALALPVSAIAALYEHGGEALNAALPAAASLAQGNEGAYPAAVLLQTAGLPLALETAALQAELAAAAAEAEAEEAARLADEESILVIAKAPEEAAAAQPSGEPQVVIYCTHAGEGYAGETRVNGKAGGVMTVAATLKEAFEAAGVGVILDETLHDSPSYDDSYNSSLRAVTEIAAEHPQIEVYIDVHRDSSIAGISTQLTTEIGSFAKMMLVVGTNENLPHPDWQQNYTFAKAVTAAASELQPGIMREPRVYSGRYNQHVAPKAILVEIGSTDNTLEEAKRSAQILAKAVISCM